MDDSALPADEQLLLQRLAAGEAAALEAIFNRYYKGLCHLALRYVNTGEIAEELVSDILTNLWQQRETLQIRFSLQAYLCTAVKNACLNYLKSQFARQQFESARALDQQPEAFDTSLELEELEKLLEAGIRGLPPACRTIFTLSRNAGMSYEEIARSLGLSKKTVKAQMGIALQKLRHYLHQHWDKFLLLLLPFSR